jgi:lipoic acid synthetase
MTQFPDWIRRPWPSGERVEATRRIIDRCDVTTVCVSARCPNIGECYAARHATFMILGDACTRSCAFCSVRHGTPEPVSTDGPGRVARAAAEMELEHVVITSVTRDDLDDGGAREFALTVRAVREAVPKATVEVLTPDFGGSTDAVRIVVDAGPDVFGHNVETVPRLTSRIRSGAEYQRSLDTLATAGRAGATKRLVIKSGLMVGMGEYYEEVIDVLKDLRAAGCEIATIGQYLRPSDAQAPVREFVQPEMFETYREEGLDMGFADVSSGPFVRSSYRARDMLKAAMETAHTCAHTQGDN